MTTLHAHSLQDPYGNPFSSNLDTPFEFDFSQLESSSSFEMSSIMSGEDFSSPPPSPPVSDFSSPPPSPPVSPDSPPSTNLTASTKELQDLMEGIPEDVLAAFLSQMVENPLGAFEQHTTVDHQHGQLVMDPHAVDSSRHRNQHLQAMPIIEDIPLPLPSKRHSDDEILNLFSDLNRVLRSRNVTSVADFLNDPLLETCELHSDDGTWMATECLHPLLPAPVYVEPPRPDKAKYCMDYAILERLQNLPQASEMKCYASLPVKPQFVPNAVFVWSRDAASIKARYVTPFHNLGNNKFYGNTPKSNSKKRKLDHVDAGGPLKQKNRELKPEHVAVQPRLTDDCRYPVHTMNEPFLHGSFVTASGDAGCNFNTPAIYSIFKDATKREQFRPPLCTGLRTTSRSNRKHFKHSHTPALPSPSSTTNFTSSFASQQRMEGF